MRTDLVVPGLVTAGTVALGSVLGAAESSAAVDVGAPLGVGVLLVAGAMTALASARSRDAAVADAYQAGVVHTITDEAAWRPGEAA